MPLHITKFTQPFSQASLERLGVRDSYVKRTYPSNPGLLRVNWQAPEMLRTWQFYALVFLMFGSGGSTMRINDKGDKIGSCGSHRSSS